MDIFNLVGYDDLHPLKLLNPATGEELGISFKIRCSGSDFVSKILRRHIDEMKSFHMDHKDSTEKEQSAALIKLVEAQQVELHASYIAEWNWGEHFFKNEKPEYSHEKAIEVMEVNWIFNAVRNAAMDLKLFMNA